MSGRHARNKGRSAGTVAYLGIIVLVIGLVGFLFYGFYQQTAAKTATPVRINMSGFSPGEIRVKAGEKVQVELINMDNAGHTDGGGWHNFVSDELGVAEKVPPMGRQVFTFVPAKPGVYDFYCDICCGGKESPYMHGRVVVS